ncbi:MAG: FAD-binding protein [Verrucomicrobia bacterium]|nr:FAD-binding protein [Verrucomicrobiota bacterium]
MISERQRRILAASGCEIAFDPLTRQLYSTDASIYRIEPAGIAFPSTAEQAVAVIRGAAAAGLSVIPRGAGSGLVGGAIGDGLVIDFARHNRQITELNLDRRTVRVGAGVVLDQLNAFLRPHGFCFGPDVATSSRATLGGMIANNSSGAHVPVYGTTADHLESLEVILADGTVETVGKGLTSLPKQRRLIADLVRRYATQISERTPDGLLKRWPAYGIGRCMKDSDDLSQILSGSEGTLAAIQSAELKIVPVPREKGLCLIFFASVSEAMQATVALLPLRPAAVEHIDRVLFDQTRGQIPFQSARDLLDLDARPCESILMVEFYEDVEDRLESVAKMRLGLRTLTLRSRAEMDMVWALRKAGLSLLTGCKGSAKPVTGIEDTAVKPEHLPEYVASLDSLMKSIGVEACYYGHAAAGLLHIRPVLDLHSAGDVRKFRQLADEVSALVRKFKGSLAAEHGVGIARTEFLKEQLGEELLSAMREIKTSFDPGMHLNPGKIVGDGRYRFDRNLRMGGGYELRLPFNPVLAFAAKDGSFAGNLEQCNGCGGCRKSAPTMCPTFLATGDEIMSTRGRANTIRAALELRFGDCEDPLHAEELEAALSNCLSCKACTSECPSNVNLSLLKAELLNARHRRSGLSFREWMFSSVDLLGELGCFAPTLANSSLLAPWFRRILKRVAGVSEARPLPSFAFERFDRWFNGRSRSSNVNRGKVILWDDTFVRYHEPHIGKAAVAVLEAAGFEVELLEGRACCGRPAFSQGNLDRAARLGSHNLSLLDAKRRARRDTPILFLEPSCYSMFAEDYRELRLAAAEDVANRCFLFEQFMENFLRENPGALGFSGKKETVAIHAHCHVKAIVNPQFLARLVDRLPGRKSILLNTGCCGMAGAFGALESKYALSIKVGKLLADQILELGVDPIVVASGTSCRHQIEHLTPVRPRHMAEYLAAQLEKGKPQQNLSA